MEGREPIIIGHRGASGYRPEHTLASYQLAIDLGADFIEPDLVATRDGVLIARHENEIGGTTNVANHPEFASRRTTKIIDGVSITGWFAEDFTLAEVKTLRARERPPDVRPQNATFDGQFDVATFQEVIDLAKRAGSSPGERERVGVYPEIKHPTYFRGIGLPLEQRVVDQLHATGYRGRNAPIFIQAFEVGTLKALDRMTDLPLVQLIDGTGKPFDFVVAGDPRTYADMVTPAGLAEIARYADGIAPNKGLIIPRGAGNHLMNPTTLVRDTHRVGLVLHPWTFRRENTFLPEEFRVGNPADPTYLRQPGNAIAEDELFFRLGVDGIFTDNPDIGVQARRPLSRDS